MCLLKRRGPAARPRRIERVRMQEVRIETVNKWPAAVRRRLEQGERIAAVVYRRRGEEGQSSHPAMITLCAGHYYVGDPPDLITLDDTDLIAKPLPPQPGTLRS
jgi:phosphoenolpyruvate carboxylase